MPTILIAARSESFCRALADIAANRFHVVICHDGARVLDQIVSGKRDILVLDMELPGMDGISILSAIRATKYPIAVIALTACIQSAYLSQMTADLAVDYIIAKPCTASAVLKNACEIMECRDNKEQSGDLNTLIDVMLLELNFNARPCGYPCLVEAIKLYNADPTQQITKSLYPEVAKVCGGSSKRVEHAIRGCIHDAWSSRNESIWKMYFPTGRKAGNPPTNGNFIAKMAKCLENVKTG